MKKEMKSDCQKAAEFFCDYLYLPSEIPQAVRRHIEACGECRENVRRLQDALDNPEPAERSVRIDLLRSQIPLYDQWVSCTQAKPFLPLWTVPGWVPSVPTPAAAHLAHCSCCRQDLTALKGLSLSPAQALSAGRVLCGDSDLQPQLPEACRKVLQTILHRQESDVAVKLSQAPDGAFHVEVARRTAAEQTKTAAVGRRPFRWVRYAAAAALLMAGLLLWQVKPVRGLDISEVYQALGQAVNIAMTSYPLPGSNLIIASYALDEPGPLQEIWVSNSLGVQLFIEKERAVLWDLNRQTKTIKTLQGFQTVPITQPMKKFDIPWGLLPFRSPDELPSKYKWKQVRVQQEEEPLAEVKVYDLTWTDYSALGRSVQRRWRGVLDAKTKFPLRIEWWEKLDNRPFEKISSTIIRYPQESEVLSRIAAEGFDYRPPVQK
jgi:hypothetical protein